MLEGILRAHLRSPLTSPLTSTGVAGWLFAARFWSAPDRALQELDRLEAGGVLALTAPFHPRAVPRPPLPLDRTAGSDIKTFERATHLMLDLSSPLGRLSPEVPKAEAPGALRPLVRPRLRMDRARGTVAEEQGFFLARGFEPQPRRDAKGHPLPLAPLELLVRTDLWDGPTLATLCAIATELGFGGRRTQGWGQVDLAFEPKLLPQPAEPVANPTYGLAYGDVWPGEAGPAADSRYTTRLHHGAGDRGPFKPPVLFLAPGSLLPLAGEAAGWVTVGEVLRTESDGRRPLLATQALAWPVAILPEVLHA